MSKFTKFESGIIIECLKLARFGDLKSHEEIVEAGKNPIMTAEFIQETYDTLIERVKEMTKKK